jgi:enterochelin esterase-like enzyme
MRVGAVGFGVRAGAVLAASVLSACPPAQAQPPARPPEFVSPEVGADRGVTFRLWAPKAAAATVSGGDMAQLGAGLAMTRGAEGVWTATAAAVEPGAYRYRFSVDGLEVVDPRNGAVSESNGNVWSLVYVPGSPTSDALDVPHGAVAEVTYLSHSLGRFRRMHVYTPPGYEAGEGRFPVLYLLHGAFDCDDAWTSVGRAGFIMDNLIAAGRARPMVVAMPAGHTGPFGFGPRGGGQAPRVDEFVEDFTRDLKPYVESHYRVIADRGHRALAGLSMGGMQTLDIAVASLQEYGYLGVFSSGVFGIAGGGGPFAQAGPSWEEQHKAALSDAGLKQGLRLVWFATGQEDFLLPTTRGTVDMLRGNRFEITYTESAGGHTWTNWRQYLSEFAPLLFTEEAAGR